jgi:uncharacterized protein YdeI (YjbR/CyaY-like superfamily)
VDSAQIEFFPSPAAFRQWLEKHHGQEKELWVGFYKKGSGTEGITWKESVDEALCFGWIDGVRKSIDDTRYKIRFTPRKPGSIWSLVNKKRVEELTQLGRMTPAGLKAFESRDQKKTGIYAYESAEQKLDPASEKRFRANEKAWEFFQSQPAWYRRTAIFRVVSAKKEETREKRLARLIEDSEQGKTIAELTRPGTRKSG